MTDNPTPKTAAAQALADLVAKRKAHSGDVSAKHAYPGARQSERAASARSMSKSKPAMGR